MKKRLLIVYVLLVLIISSSFIPMMSTKHTGNVFGRDVNSVEITSITSPPGLDENINLTLHNTIKIDGENDLENTASQEGWNGSGTKEDPYIIERYNITAETFETGIKISNTTSHFKIQNCRIHDALKIREQTGTGIYLDNVKNGLIENNLIDDNYRDGIKVINSEDIEFNNNTVIDNQNNGISIIDSADVTSITNSFSKNNNRGVFLNRTDKIQFTKNEIKNNKGGSSISSSHEVLFSKNNLSHNEADGLMINESLSLDIIDNKIIGCGETGISIKHSFEDLIQKNHVRSNGKAIFIYKSEKEKIFNNIIHDNERGLILEKSTEAMIENNDLKNNFLEILYGSKRSWSSHTIDGSNTIDDEPILYIKNEQELQLNRDYSQLIIANCTGITIDNMKLTDMYSIDIGHSKDISITDNTIEDFKTSIRLISTSDSNIMDNLFLNNQRALHIFASNENIIFNNEVKQANKDGIYISNSFNNIVANNTISRNQNDGIDARNSFANLIKDNLLIKNKRYGINMHANSKLNKIYQNTFLRNNGAGLSYDPDHLQAYGNGDNFWNQSSGIGNYWRDWTSPDSNSNAVVDSPYIIAGDSGARDHHPLTKSPTPLIPLVTDFKIEVKSGVVRLSWNKPAKEGFLEIDQFWIYREDDKGSTFYVGNTSSSQLTFNDTSPKEKGTYTYYVRAVNITENEVEGSLPSKKLSIEYRPKEEQDLTPFIWISIIGIAGVVMITLLLYKKIERNKNKE